MRTRAIVILIATVTAGPACQNARLLAVPAGEPVTEAVTESVARRDAGGQWVVTRHRMPRAEHEQRQRIRLLLAQDTEVGRAEARALRHALDQAGNGALQDPTCDPDNFTFFRFENYQGETFCLLRSSDPFPAQLRDFVFSDGWDLRFANSYVGGWNPARFYAELSGGGSYEKQVAAYESGPSFVPLSEPSRRFTEVNFLQGQGQ